MAPLLFLALLLQDPAFEEAKTLARSAIEKRKAGDLDGAVADLTKAIERSPRFAYAWGTRGYIKNLQGDHKGAIADLTKAIEINPKNAASDYNNRGFAKHELGDFNGAIQDFSAALALNPKDVNAYDNRGNSRRAKREYDAAILDHSKAIELQPGNVVAYNNRAKTKRAKGDYAGAIADHTKALELDPADTVVVQGRGVTYFVSGAFDKAADDFTTVIKDDPENAYHYALRGDARCQSGKLAEAQADFRKACELSDDASESHRLRLWLVRSRAGERKEAGEELRKFLETPGRERSPLDPVAEYLLDRRTEEQLLKSADLPGETAHFYIGCRRLLDGNGKGAAEAFTKSAAMKTPASPDVRCAVLELARLKGK